MKDFISTCNISFNWEERLRTQEKYNLYVSDCFWVFDIGDYYEFYYNPKHFIGKIKKEQMPAVVVERIKTSSAAFTNGNVTYDRLEQEKLHRSLTRFRRIEKDMRIGNWFYAQGQNYATWKGMFICDDVYVEGLERECTLKEISGGAVYDMVRMSCKTRTPNYIYGIFDLSIFQGVNTSTIRIYPFDEFWDSKQWATDFKEISEHFQKYNSGNDMDIIKGMRAEVFLHTVNVIQEGKYSLDGATFDIPKDESENMVCNTVFYEHEFNVSDIPVSGEETTIVVENDDCLSAAKKMQSQGYKVAVLNMASRQNPGGGVIGGAGAQEENLFRRTNLFQSMFRYARYATKYGLKQSVNQYPLDRNYGGIYTPDALVLRGEEKNGYPLLGEDSLKMSFISVPGMNRPELTPEGLIIDSLIEPVKNKMRTILRIGLRHGHDSLVLGALGCGAFCNPPSHIAKLFHEVFEEPEFKNKYRLISFAIIDDHNSHQAHNPEGNYKPFVDEFFGMGNKKNIPSPEALKALTMWTMGAGNSAKRFNGENPIPAKTDVATKDSWKTLPMPEQHTTIPLGFVLPDNAMECVKYGHIPDAMEDHWFMYCDDSTIRYYRSWTGYCIYEAKYKKVDDGYEITELIVNRFPEQYGCNDDKHDLALFMALLTEEYGGDASQYWDSAVNNEL